MTTFRARGQFRQAGREMTLVTVKEMGLAFLGMSGAAVLGAIGLGVTVSV